MRKSEEAFAKATTNQAFVLTLSRHQVAGLECMRDGVSYQHIHQATLNSLTNKGLIEKHSFGIGESRKWESLTYRITHIGLTVLTLCEMAGLVDSRPELAKGE